MKTYTIHAEAITCVKIQIEASSENEAWDIARETAHKYWTPVIDENCPAGLSFIIDGEDWDYINQQREYKS